MPTTFLEVFRRGQCTHRTALTTILMALLCLCQMAHAHLRQDQPLELDEDFSYASAAAHTRYILDASNDLNLAQIIDASDWRMLPGTASSFGFSNASLWLALSLENKAHRQTYYVSLEYPLLDQVEFYQPDASGQYRSIITGDRTPLSSRPLKDRFFTFPVVLDPGQQTTLYWRVSSTDTLVAPITVATRAAYHSQQITTMTLFGMYYGAIVIIILINSILYFILRQTAQVYYVALLAVYAVIELSLNGTGNLFLWAQVPEFTKLIRPAALGLLSILIVKLTKSYLELPRIGIGRFNLEPLLMVPGLLAILGTALLPFTQAIQLALIGMSVIIPFILGITCYHLYQGNNAARYYFFGWIGFFVGGTLNIMRAFDLVDMSFITTYGSQIGSLATLVILNMGLTNQFRQMQRLREQRKEGIIRQQERLNQELDLAVQERTRELEAQTREADHARHIAEQALATKSQFLANMSHEIRTPMNGVLGITQLLMDTPLDQHQRHLINTIRHSGDTLVSIINDILDYSKIEAGKLNIEYIALNLYNLLDDCIELFATTTSEKRIRLLLHISPDTPETIMGDPTRLRQVIINLLGNAIKFTQHGYVILAASYRAELSELQIRVKDTGIGISDEQQRNLFESFSQADSSTTRKFGGTGLGLAISRSLTSLMGGRLSVRSQQEHGSEFWLELPCTALSVAPAIPALQHKRVVINDPLPAATCALRDMLQSWGMEVIDHNADLPESVDLVIRHSSAIEQVSPWQRNTPILDLIPLQETTSAPENSIQDPFTRAQLLQALRQLFCPSTDQKRHNPSVQDYSMLNVLVAEDNQVNQLVIKGLLGKFNITPDLAQDGLEALQRVEASATPYDLILMDCEMPNLDGYQATERLCRLPQCQLTRIVGLSAHAMAEHRDAALAAGMASFITKPIVVDTLAEELATCCTQWQAKTLPK